MAEKALKKSKGRYDTMLLFAALGLVAMGLIMVYSSSSALAAKSYGSDSYFLKRQACFALAGLLALALLRYVPYELYRKLAYPILLSALVFLGLLFAPGISVNVGGATRWLKAGPVNFQPSEFARIAVIIYLAYSMARKDEKMTDFAVGVVPHILVVVMVAGLFMVQPDFGSAVLLAAVSGFMLFAGGARLGHLALLVLAALPIAALLVLGADYRLMRVMAFLNPWESQLGEGYQITHSLMAFGTGGITGVGVGNGYQKLFYLPEPHTDFVFSVLGEEMGLWGVGVVVALYCILVGRGLAVVMKVKDPFGRYLAFGIVTAIGLQAFVNMAVTMGMLPTKGLALPFISYGGSSLLFNMAAIGILENIASRHNARKAPAPVKKTPAPAAAARKLELVRRREP